MLKRCSKYCLALLLLVPIAALAESATVIRTTQLVASPAAGARAVATLYGDSRVEILQRNGGWYQVRDASSGRSGWLRLTSVRLGEQTAEENETGFWGSLFSFTGRSGSRTATATTGIRGLGEDDIAGAVPDTRAVAGLDRFQASADDANRFARELGLQSKQVKHLPEDVEE